VAVLRVTTQLLDTTQLRD